MKIFNVAKKLGLGLALGGLFAWQAGATIAYNDAALNTPTSTLGNQSTGPFALGQEFTVNSALTVGYLGAFDSGMNGWGSDTITVAMYNITAGNTLVESANFFGTGASEGTLGANSSFRFQSVTPFTLSAGSTYMIVANGLGSSQNPDYNSAFTPGNNSLITLNTFGGALSYGGNYYNINPSGFPSTLDINPVPGPGRYGAGTFAPVPEAASFALAGIALLGLVYAGRAYSQRLKLA
jgi:hypothetical protein